MKIGQYCQRQRCRHVELDQFLGRLSRRAGLSAIAGLSCYESGWIQSNSVPITELIIRNDYNDTAAVTSCSRRNQYVKL